jgi:hypothetical protein
MAETWSKFVPDSASPPTAIPLTYHKYLQQNIPVYKALILTASGGTTVSLPAAFTSQISSTAEYGVQLTKQSFDPNGGELYISDKTTSGFKVRNSGSYYGESVLVTVFWIAP